MPEFRHPSLPTEYVHLLVDSIVESINSQLRGDEDSMDVIAGGWILGERRSRLLRRELIISEDIPFALSIFCFYPWKPALHHRSRERLLEARKILFAGATRENNNSSRFDAVVSNDVLQMSRDELLITLAIQPIGAILSLADISAQDDLGESGLGVKS